MRLKKWTALLLVLMMIVAMVTGCSPVEKDFYKLAKEVADANSYEFKGSMELTVEELPKSIFRGSPAISEDVLKQMVNNNRIDYQGTVNYTQDVVSCALTLVDKTSGAQTPLTKVILKDNQMYIKMDDIVSYIKKWSNDEEKQKLDKAFGGVEYLNLSPQDLQGEVGTLPGATPVPPVWKNDFLTDSKEMNRVYFRLFDALVYNAYDNYSSNLVTKDGNKYTVSLKFAEAGSTFKPLAVYTINNIYKIGTVLKEFLSGLSDDELSKLGMTKRLNEQAMGEIDSMIDDVNLNRDKYLAQLESGVGEMDAEMAKILGDSSMLTTLEKKDGNTYESTAKISLNLTDESESLKMTLSSQETKTLVGNLTVDLPSNSISFQELKKRLPVKLAINIDEGTYNRDTILGDEGIKHIEVRNIKGASYLPLRSTAGLLNLKAGWDGYLEQGFIDINGAHQYVEGQLIDGVTYVRAREFEQFGYSVSWDETARTITIQKD